MEESILNTIKQALGIEDDYQAFDSEIILGINTTLMILNQLGVGPDKGYRITGSAETWSDYLSNDVIDLEGVKTYIQISTRIIFDPPTSSIVLEAMNKYADEIAWRIREQVERKEETTDGSE